jgi:dolichol-phosphate mannosyltransferase
MTDHATASSPEPIPDLSVVLPCYLEADNLRFLLPQIKAMAATLTPNYEVLIVDTQKPKDDTPAICAAEGVRYIGRRGGDSYGDAIRTIIEEARGAFLLCMDADGSHSPDYFPAMWEKRNTYDIVIGSRYAPGGHTENPAVLILMSYVLNLTFRLAFSIQAKDVTNSFRLYRRNVLTSLKLQSNDFDILEEILIKATVRKQPATIGEIPVTFGRRKAGESKRKLMKFAFGYVSTLNKLLGFARSAKQEMETR